MCFNDKKPDYSLGDRISSKRTSSLFTIGNDSFSRLHHMFNRIFTCFVLLSLQLFESSTQCNNS